MEGHGIQVQALVSALRLGDLDKGTRGLFVDLLMSRLSEKPSDGGDLVAAVLHEFGSRTGRRWARQHGQTRGLVGSQSRKANERGGMETDTDKSQHSDETEIPSVDIAIITVKRPELEAILGYFGVPIGVSPEPLSDEVEVWRAVHGGLKVAVAVIGDAGNVTSSIEAGKLIHAVDARLYALVGMAIGVRGQVELGDVVVGSHVWGYESRVQTPDGHVPRSRVTSVPSRDLQRVSTLLQVDPEWPSRVQAEASALGYLPPKSTEWRPEVTVGVIASGEKLLEDNGALLEQVAREQGRVKAGEMEGAGFSQVCENEKVNWLVVRGIADFGEGVGRTKNWQRPATYAAVSALMSLLDRKRIRLDARGNPR